MARPGGHSTLAHLFESLRDIEVSESALSIPRRIGRNSFRHETHMAEDDHMERYMRKKCDCTVTKNEVLLEGLQLYRLGDTHNKVILKNSASRVLKQLEKDMGTTSKAGRPNVMAKWLDTRYDKPPPEDYEFRHCLKSILLFDPVEKAYAIDDVTSNHGEPALDQIYLSPPEEKNPRPRRNAFGAVQLCPHSLNQIIGKKAGSELRREDHVIDFLTNVATMNRELVQPRAGTKRAESLYYDSMFNHVLLSKDD